MATWQIEVPPEKLDEKKDYFLAQKGPMGGYSYYCRWLNGKEAWGEKPGIAVRFIGDARLQNYLRDHPKYLALEIPKDAATRWKARKHKRSWR